MRSGRVTFGLLAGCLLASVPCLARDSWISRDGEALELLLAHQERSGPDVGMLRVDPLQRTVIWEGLGPQACQHRIAARFDDVKGVRSRRDGSFVLQLVAGAERSLVLIPLPHAEWLTAPYTVDPGRMEVLLEGSDVFTGRGSSRSAGMPGAAAPSIRSKDPTTQVVADTGKAVDGILELLGRPPAPLAVLREALHGRPVDVSVAEVLQAPASYDGRSIRLHGHVESLSPGQYRLLDEGSAMTLLPEPGIAPLVQVDAPHWDGEIEITGLLERRDGTAAVRFWDYSSAAPGAQPPPVGDGLSLQALSKDPKSSEGRMVSVIGKFRGRNLYGDLPTASRLRESDWVIKDGRWAVWVTGSEPAGKGWRLDPRAPGDTSQWVEVRGRPRTRNGVTVLRALEVRPVPVPPGARVLPPRQLSIAREAAPVVVFLLPTEGEPISPDARFVIQFSKYMDEESFRGQVRLSYPEGTGPTSGEIPVRTRYDETLRALIVEPEASLEPGSTVEIRLLPGILDVHGLALIPRVPGAAAGIVDAFRYRVGS